MNESLIEVVYYLENPKNDKHPRNLNRKNCYLSVLPIRLGIFEHTDKAHPVLAIGGGISMLAKRVNFRLNLIGGNYAQ